MSARTKTLMKAGCALLAGAFGLVSPALAQIKVTDFPDFMLVIWDPVAQVSYTRAVIKQSGINNDEFWKYAQQDSGYTSYQYKLDASDPALKAFRTASTNIANEKWAVLALDSGPSLNPGDTKVFTTLTQGPDDGTLNPNYAAMTSAAWGDVALVARNAQFDPQNSFVGGMNFSFGNPALFTHGNSGGYFTSFDKLGSGGYFAGGKGVSSDGKLAGFSITNSVNKSSWFYYLTNDSKGNLVVDEFDNLTSNGYWGLSIDTSAPATSQYLLSFTQAAAKSGANSATTALGLQRTAVTDYAAGLGASQLLGLEPGPDSLTVSAVPEPQAWALMALGLSVVGWRSRAMRKATASR